MGSKTCQYWFLWTAGCEVYNLGTGKGTSVLEMVAAFEKASGKVSYLNVCFDSPDYWMYLHLSLFKTLFSSFEQLLGVFHSLPQIGR